MRTQREAPAHAGNLEFLVELRTVIPVGTNAAEEAEAHRGEAVRMAQLATAGHVLRLWRISDHDGEFTTGPWRAADENALRGMLDSLPLAPWMNIVVHPCGSTPTTRGDRSHSPQ